jgi:transcriptional regulator with XRE-family HTH domain
VPDTPELAAALRQWRERLDPPRGTGRRRTPGLRREEVAERAGVSVDYVVRLEQDRGPHPSPAVLGALGRALALTDAETGHLFDLAGVVRPGDGTIRTAIRPSVRRLLDRVHDLPAMVVDGRLDVVHWNPLAAALVGDPGELPPERRSHLWLQFAAPERSRLVVDDATRLRLDRATVAQARTAVARHPDDARLRATVAALRAGVPRFARLWDERPVEYRYSDRKTYAVPGIGPVTVDCECLAVPDDDQLVVFYSAAPGSVDEQRLDRMRAALRVQPPGGPSRFLYAHRGDAQ